MTNHDLSLFGWCYVIYPPCSVCEMYLCADAMRCTNPKMYLYACSMCHIRTDVCVCVSDLKNSKACVKLRPRPSRRTGKVQDMPVLRLLDPPRTLLCVPYMWCFNSELYPPRSVCSKPDVYIPNLTVCETYLTISLLNKLVSGWS